MFLKIFAVLPFFFAPPDFRINWQDEFHKTVNVSLSGYNETVLRCIESGLEVRYRFEFELCQRRTLWFHSCKEKKAVLQSLELDPISQSYEIMRDRLGDKRSGTKSSVSSRDEGLAAVSNVSELPLEFLSEGDDEFEAETKLYVSARVLATCRGQYNETLARIGYFLTLGLVRISALNTGWIDFNLDKNS